MTEEKSWEEFRNAGFLWLINQTLHLFGWAIVVEFKDCEIARVYPARTRFRGFSEECNDVGYKAVTKYMKDNVDKLVEETEK